MNKTIRIELGQKTLRNGTLANRWITTHKDYKLLAEYDLIFTFTTQLDLDWCKTEECGNPDYCKKYFTERIGQSDSQVSAMKRVEDDERIEEFEAKNNEKIYKAYVDFIIDFRDKFNIKFLFTGMFHPDEDFFKLEDLRTITKNGDLFIGLDDNRDTQKALNEFIDFKMKQKTWEEVNQVGTELSETNKALSSTVRHFTSNKNFYPTPDSLIRKMLDKIDYDRNFDSILEPSAGKGNIIKYMQNYKTYLKKHREYSYQPFEKADFFAIEPEEDLQSILNNNYNTTLLDSDFLAFNSLENFDLIVMNPPFDNGEDHLQKAIDIMFTGQIVCVLNANTIKNPYSNSRKRLIKTLKSLNAEIEYVDGAFDALDSERKTNVESAIIYINITRNVEEDFFEKMEDDEVIKDYEDVLSDKFEVATLNSVRNLVIQFNKEKEIVANQIMDFYKNYNSIERYVSLKVKGSDDELKDDDKKDRYHLTRLMSKQLNTFSKSIKKDYWRKVLSLKEVKSKLTQAARKSLESKINDATKKEFTEANIRQFIINLINNFSNTIQGSIEWLFDKFTEHAIMKKENGDTVYSEYLNSIHYFNGWKTNDAYKVGKKVIMPFYRKEYDWKYNSSLSFEKREFIDDLDLILSYFDGNTGRCGISDMISNALQNGINKKIETKYLYVSIYKKGTIHFEFRDLDMLRRFNITACKRKNFIHHDYATKPYTDLSQEEKDAVAEFETEKTYDVVSNAIRIDMKPMSSFLLADKTEVEVDENQEITLEEPQEDIQVNIEESELDNNKTSVAAAVTVIAMESTIDVSVVDTLVQLTLF